MFDPPEYRPSFNKLKKACDPLVKPAVNLVVVYPGWHTLALETWDVRPQYAFHNPTI